MTQEISHDVYGIANAILEQSPNHGIKKITPMKLLKLVYIAHGWSCAFHTIPLVKELPHAWKYGPVYPKVYNKLEKYIGEPIPNLLFDKKTGEIYTASLSEPQKSLIACILKNYGKLYATELSNLTHQEGSPWDITVKTTGYYTPIPLEIIRMHYQQKIKNNSEK